MALSGSITTNYWTADDGTTRGYQLSWTATQSISNNTSTISWTLSTAGTYAYQVAERTLKATLAGKTLINKTDRVMRGKGTVTSGSFTLTHASDGTLDISGSITAAIYDSTADHKASGTWKLNTIPRGAIITDAPNFHDEENPILKYTNPAGSVVDSIQACISLDTSKADIEYREIPLDETSYTFELTEDERNVLRKATVGSNSRSVYFFVMTKIGENTFFNKLKKMVTIIDALPTLSPTIKDINQKTFDLTKNEKMFIKGHSIAEVSTGAKAYKEATITSQKISNGNKVVNGSSGQINALESGIFEFTATDSRNNIITKTVTEPDIKFIDYVNVTCDLNIGSPDAEGDLDFSVTGNCYKGNLGVTENVVKVYYRYKVGNGLYIDWVENEVVMNNDGTYTSNISLTGLDYRKSHTFQAKTSDLLSEKTSVEKTVNTIPLFDWGENDFNFNIPVNVEGNISIKGNSITDYIVEQGTSGIWTYRKWNSGIAECWGITASATHSLTSEYGTGYYKDSNVYNFPSDLFTAVPVSTSKAVGITGLVDTSVSQITSTSISIRIWSSKSLSWSGTIHITAIGRWK